MQHRQGRDLCRRDVDQGVGDGGIVPVATERRQRDRRVSLPCGGQSLRRRTVQRSRQLPAQQGGAGERRRLASDEPGGEPGRRLRHPPVVVQIGDHPPQARIQLHRQHQREQVGLFVAEPEHLPDRAPAAVGIERRRSRIQCRRGFGREERRCFGLRDLGCQQPSHLARPDRRTLVGTGLAGLPQMFHPPCQTAATQSGQCEQALRGGAAGHGSTTTQPGEAAIPFTWISTG